MKNTSWNPNWIHRSKILPIKMKSSAFTSYAHPKTSSNTTAFHKKNKNNKGAKSNNPKCTILTSVETSRVIYTGVVTRGNKLRSETNPQQLQIKPKLSTSFTQTPWIGFMVSVIKWFNPLLSLALAHFCGIWYFEESRCQFNKPFRVNNCDLPHVLLCSHYQLVVDHPVWLSLKQGTARMYVHRLVFH